MNNSDSRGQIGFVLAARGAAPVLLAAWLARLIFALILPSDTYSLDVRNFQVIIAELQAGRNPYQTTYYLNAAPFLMQWLWLCSRIADFLGLHLLAVLQFLLTLIESVIIVVLYREGLGFLPAQRVKRILLWGISLNPVCILLVCQHAQIDLLVGLVVLAAVLSVARFAASGDPFDWLIAAFSVGLGILIKTVPLALLPLLAFGLQKLPKKALGLGAVLIFGPALLALSVVFVLSPAEVVERVIFYGSVPGFFGITGLLGLIGETKLYAVYHKLFFAVFLALLVLLTAAFRKAAKMNLAAAACGSIFLLALIPAFGLGFGHQYIYWFLPLLLLQLFFVSSRDATLIRAFFGLAALTYALDYAFSRHLGAFMLKVFEGSPEFWLFNAATSAGGHTLLSLPLFIVWAALVLRQGYCLLFNNLWGNGSLLRVFAGNRD